MKTFPLAYPGLSPTERADPSDFPLQRLFEQTFPLAVAG